MSGKAMTRDDLARLVLEERTASELRVASVVRIRGDGALSAHQHND